MKIFQALSAGVVLLAAIISVNTVMATESDQKLFVNLSNDDLNRAAMAIGFSTNVLTKKKIPVTIFLNVEGVRIADKNIPESKYVNGKSLKQMLSEFIKAGGKVIICPMCMNNVGGIKQEEVLDGVTIGGPEVTWPALFADNTTVLSY